MKCKRRYMHGKKLRRSPIKQNPSLGSVVTDVAKSELISRVVAPIIGSTAAATGGAAIGIIQGYGDLAKTDDGKQVIKDARMMPMKM